MRGERLPGSDSLSGKEQPALVLAGRLALVFTAFRLRFVSQLELPEFRRLKNHPATLQQDLEAAIQILLSVQV